MQVAEIIGISLSVILWIVCGFLSRDLQEKKGYNGGFLIGFLLGMIGLIYSAGLPDITDKKISTYGNEHVIERVDSDNDLPQNKNFVYCKKCGFPVYEDETECSNCGVK